MALLGLLFALWIVGGLVLHDVDRSQSSRLDIPPDPIVLPTDANTGCANEHFDPLYGPCHP